jgi:hypothetical protein
MMVDVFTLTDWQCVARLDSREPLPPLGLYKALSGLANNGATRPEEVQLPPGARLLLEARRLLKERKLEEFDRLAERYQPRTEDPGFDQILIGDLQALRAMRLGKEGKFEEAREAALTAAELFANTPDLHRELRARINAEIFLCTLETYLIGTLYSLEQSARRAGFDDLAGNIRKGRTIQLMDAARFEEALAEATGAAAAYECDGCPEDRAVAQTVLAILHLIAGHVAEAQIAAGKVHFKDGKVKPYFEAYQALVSGKKPQVPEGHPLALVPWPVHQVKKDSISGKILRRLSEGPATRDELIAHVWGEKALDPSYNARLYTAINQLRKKEGHAIVFDGSVYRLN